MAARISYGGAAVLLLVALLGLRVASREVAHYSVALPGGIPAVVWEPGAPRAADAALDPDADLPVVVLAHGFAGNRAVMSALARRLALRGYAVVGFDFRGHGRNTAPFASTRGFPRAGLLDDIDAAVLWARVQGGYAGQSVALVGHAMGASAVMDYAARRDPAMAAVVAISGSSARLEPYTPPNVLLIWAERDASDLRAQAREVGASLIGRSQIVLDRDYGDPRRGTAVRATEVPGSGHVSVLYSEETARRIADWLDATVGGGAEARMGASGGDPRQRWAALGLAAALVLLFGLPRVVAPLARHVAAPTPGRPLAWLGVVAGALLAALVLLAALDARAGSALLELSPLLVGRDVAALLGIAGLISVVVGARSDRVRAEGLADPRTWTAAALFFICFAAVAVVLLAPFVDLAPSGPRIWPWALASLAALPFFGATEWLLRGPGRSGIAAAIAGKLVLLGVLVAAALAGVVPGLWHALVPLAALLVLLEGIAFRISRVMPNPWVGALFQSAALAWYLAALFPLAR